MDCPYCGLAVVAERGEIARAPEPADRQHLRRPRAGDRRCPRIPCVVAPAAQQVNHDRGTAPRSKPATEAASKRVPSRALTTTLRTHRVAQRRPHSRPAIPAGQRTPPGGGTPNGHPIRAGRHSVRLSVACDQKFRQTAQSGGRKREVP